MIPLTIRHHVICACEFRPEPILQTPVPGWGRYLFHMTSDIRHPTSDEKKGGLHLPLIRAPQTPCEIKKKGKSKNMKKKFLVKALSFLVALRFIIGMLPATALAGTNGYTDSATGKDKYIVSSTDYAIAKGVTETDVVINSKDGNEQVMGYMLQIDFAANKDLKLKATYTGYYNGTDSSAWSVSKWGLSTTSSPAAAYENATGATVILATNGHHFTMQADRRPLPAGG